MHVRNAYDVSHVGHLTFCGFLARASFVAKPPELALLCLLAAVVWLAVWIIHALANALSAGTARRAARQRVRRLP